MIVLLLILSLVSNVFGSRILAFFFLPSYSHQIVYQPIWRELSRRGHQVTVVTPNPLHDPSLVNLTEIDISDMYKVMKDIPMSQLVWKELSKIDVVVGMCEFVAKFEEMELNDAGVKRMLLENNDEELNFDLVMIEWQSLALYGLAARFRAPLIGFASRGVSVMGHALMGTPNYPALYPDVFLNFHGPFTLWQRIESAFFTIWYQIYFNFYIWPRTDQRARKYFGDDIPYIADIAHNMSLLLMNVNPIMYPSRPLVPAVIQLHQMHIKPVQPLPQDLKTILDESQDGVVYVSFGSNVKSVHMKVELRGLLTEALSELPYTVLWKWELDDFPDRPSNVVARKWLPQQDVLAHPNVKVFVTQGGLQSMEETLARGVPIVGLPFISDQSLNVHNAVEGGFGLALDPATLTKDEFKSAIVEVATNPKYRTKATEIRDLLNDQPMPGLEKAIWWIEYVIRHKGAPHLHSPTVDLPWYQFLLLDVIFAILLPLVLIYNFVKFTIRILIAKFSKKSKIH